MHVLNWIVRVLVVGMGVLSLYGLVGCFRTHRDEYEDEDSEVYKRGLHAYLHRHDRTDYKEDSMIDLADGGSVKTKQEVERLINRLIADSPNTESDYWKDAEACIHTYRGITVTITRGS